MNEAQTDLLPLTERAPSHDKTPPVPPKSISIVNLSDSPSNQRRSSLKKNDSKEKHIQHRTIHLSETKPKEEKHTAKTFA